MIRVKPPANENDLFSCALRRRLLLCEKKARRNKWLLKLHHTIIRLQWKIIRIVTILYYRTNSLNVDKSW